MIESKNGTGIYFDQSCSDYNTALAKVISLINEGIFNLTHLSTVHLDDRKQLQLDAEDYLRYLRRKEKALI